MTTTERYRQALEKIKNDNGGEGCGYSYYRLKTLASEALASAKPNENETMPVLNPDKKLLAFVPMDILNEEWAQKNHGQSLARLKERQGLSLSEIVAISEKRKWHEISQLQCLSIIATKLLSASASKDEETEYVLASAIWYKDLPASKYLPVNIDKGVVLCGLRHGFIISTMKAIANLRTVQFGENSVGETEQGFLTSANRFVNREQAAEIAFNAGQTKTNKQTLYSEEVFTQIQYIPDIKSGKDEPQKGLEPEKELKLVLYRLVKVIENKTGNPVTESALKKCLKDAKYILEKHSSVTDILRYESGQQTNSESNEAVKNDSLAYKAGEDLEQEIERLKKLIKEGFVLVNKQWHKSPEKIEADWKTFQKQNNL